MINMIYDYIIIGSGVAGNVCAFILQKKGFSCLILEKENTRKEKICGGGVPYKALCVLDDIGMDIQKLFASDVAVIVGDSSSNGENNILNYYDVDSYSLGCRRRVFDDFLLNQAIRFGARIVWGQNVRNVCFENNVYDVNGFTSKKVIGAFGARGKENKYYYGQSIGISAQIYGESVLRNDIFHYYYYNKTDAKYFWIFPIGNNLWNVGIWFRKPMPEMMREYNECWNKYVESTFAEYKYIQKPKGEFCGNINLIKKEALVIDGIGDYAGMNNIKNGGGIYKAIKSAIKYSEAQT